MFAAYAEHNIIGFCMPNVIVLVCYWIWRLACSRKHSCVECSESECRPACTTLDADDPHAQIVRAWRI